MSLRDMGWRCLTDAEGLMRMATRYRLRADALGVPPSVLDVTVEAASALEAGQKFLAGWRGWPLSFGEVTLMVRVPADVVADESNWVIVP